MKYAAIAIGSNSTRLLIAEKQGNALVNPYRGREETRLFLGLDDQGMIAPERLENTARTVAAMAGEAWGQGAETIALFATSATRDAQNGALLGERIKSLCGLDLQIISGEEEARLAFRAVAGMERRLVMDIGGGSTEFTLGEKGHIQFAASAQMGASRLLRLCPIENEADAGRALEIAKSTLMPYARQLAAYSVAPALIGLGGSCTTCAAIQMGKIAHGEAVEGHVISLHEARRQLALLANLPLEKRQSIPGLPPARAAHMPHGLCILIAAMELCGHEILTVSGRTNLDGYLLSLPDSDKT